MANSGAWSKVLAPLRARDFRLMWSGNLVSQLGDGIFTVALALEALRVDHQPTGLAYVLACRAVPSVAFSILGGVVVDRLPRRFVVLAADLGRGAAVGLIALLVLGHDITLWQLIVMAAVFGTADAFAGPAFMALIPELLPIELITQANALNSTSSELAINLIGPAVGGLAVAVVGTAAAFGFDAASFVVAAGCLAFLHQQARPSPSGKSFLAEAVEGIHYIVSRRWLFVLLMGAAVANLVGLGPYIVLLPVFVRHVLHSSPLVLGLVYSSAGAAGVVASLVVARLGSPRHLLETMWGAYCSSGLLLAGISVAPNPWVAAILVAGSAGLLVYGDVLYFTKLQTSVPKQLMGRVSSVSFVMVWTLTPLGMIMGGFAATLLGARGAFLLSGLLAACCGLVLLIPGARTVTAEAEPA
ncbi:MAG TPA: MFS transporter [Candidatus Dormibacteraeota bacterium]|nr:MFS transporter [Candidatus Dormibacteraeota bacterium]